MTTEPLRDGRLPRSVVPKRYDLALLVEPAREEFSGTVTIQLEMREPAEAIVLHAADLDISTAVIHADHKNREGTVTFDAPSEIATVSFTDKLPKGPASLTLSFSGRLNKQMKGLYVATAGDERYAFTQFEATDARRCFPCFDEPAFKASFRISAEIPDHLMAISNMDVESERVAAAGRRKRVVFKETPAMSTYLVALGVARLTADRSEIAGTEVAVYSRPELIGLTGFAKEVMRACLPRLNEYFGLKYPIAKLDLVGVPDFAMGAMENWGAIFFRENRLLIDTSKASAYTLRGVANVITHEVVHQWFGNLVTMWWWEDLWLNEAFATWLACKIVDDWRPEWQSWVEFARDKQVPMTVDALQSTRPISSKVRTAAEAEEMFDALTYEKGASILRMLEQFLGEDLFRKGIQDYIAAHQYGNASAADLWETLAKASGQPVPAIAHDWFTKPGFPIVSIDSMDGDLRRLKIEQRRYVANPQATVSDTSPWAIPLSISFEDDSGVQHHRALLTEPRMELTLPAPQDGPVQNNTVQWAYGNAGEVGYYRTRHAPSLQTALAHSIARLSSEEQFGLLDNTWALTQKGEIAIGDFLELAGRFRGKDTRIVVEALCGYLEILGDRVVPEPEHPGLERFTLDLLMPLASLLGWDPRPGEGDEPKLTRAAILWTLGSTTHPPNLLKEIVARLERYWSDPASLDPTLVAPLIRVGARRGDRARYEQYVERYRTAAAPEERDRYLVAFGDFARPELTPEIFALIMSEDIRGQDVWKPVRVMLANPAVQGEAWAHVKMHWADLRKKGGSVGAQRIITGAKALWNETWAADVERFFKEPANHIASAERALRQTLEYIQLGLNFRRLQQDNLRTWLRSNYGE